MNHITLNGSGAHNRHLNHKIIKGARAEAWQHVDLGAAFDLKDADAIAFAQHIIHTRVFLRDGRQSPDLAIVRFDQVKALTNAGQHAQCQNINF